MTLPCLTTTAVCRSGVHCRHCRDVIRGRRFRRSLVTQFSVPAAPPGREGEFECPLGPHWEFWPAIHADPSPTPAEFADLVDHLEPVRRRPQFNAYAARHPVEWIETPDGKRLSPAWADGLHRDVTRRKAEAAALLSVRPSQ
jgi:hypothetical protein